MSTAEPLSPVEPAAQKEAKASDELIRAALGEVYDPEIGIDIVSLGLIYGTNIDDDGLLTIDMTLTTPYCPMGPIIETQAHAVCAPLPGVRDVHINLVWAPPWDPRTMASDEAQLELGIY
jgi:metal-sulfur cluster biosynthetic enzyme